MRASPSEQSYAPDWSDEEAVGQSSNGGGGVGGPASLPALPLVGRPLPVVPAPHRASVSRLAPGSARGLPTLGKTGPLPVAGVGVTPPRTTIAAPLVALGAGGGGSPRQAPCYCVLLE